MRFLKSGSENVKQVQWSIQNKDAYSIASEPFMIKLKFVYFWTGKQTANCDPDSMQKTP